MISITEIFKIGLGPSSSHTTGPMLIARKFLEEADRAGALAASHSIGVHLHGSLAHTGIGHGTPRAVMLGLLGFVPQNCSPQEAEAAIEAIEVSGRITLYKGPQVNFNPDTHISLRREIIPELHPNEMVLFLKGSDGTLLYQDVFYSIGGGFIADKASLSQASLPQASLSQASLSEGSGRKSGAPDSMPYPFSSGAEMLAHCDAHDMTIAQLMRANETTFRPDTQIDPALDQIWMVMKSCIEQGLQTAGTLPGGLNVQRRAPGLYAKLLETPLANEPERLFDWLNVYAMAVNEENAAGGRVVTAPTNGAAGIIPAVLKFYCSTDEKCNLSRIRQFLLTAASVAILCKQNASISGAEMGCQGEVGVACAMAAAGLAAVWGGSPRAVEHAAEIGLEHNLGLTCDPVGGLVQIPCIERNAIGAVKAVNAARLSLNAADTPKVSLDQVIETMRQTGLDMSSKYKETSEGGLAVNVPEC